MRSLIAFIKVMIIALAAFSVAVLQPFLMLCFFWKEKEPVWFLPHVFHTIACFVTKTTIEVKGEDAYKQYKDATILYASNHTSYLDIIVIGSWLKGFFVAKSDIASWPVFGFLAKLQGTIFVERRPSAAKGQKEMLLDYARRGEHLLIFPEGTTTNGVDVYPFKSSLFGAFIDPSIERDVIVQPICLSYTHIDGHVIEGEERDEVSWYKEEHELMPHLWDFLKHKSVKVTLTYLAPIPLNKQANRKQIANTCFEQVQKTHIKALEACLNQQKTIG